MLTIPSRSLLPLVLVASACRGAAPPQATVVDSAGIWIVTNDLRDTGGLPEWSLEDRPFLVVGQKADDPHHELHRVGQAKRLPDGGVLITNAREEMRIYSPEGEHRITIGRRGRGPGEFEALWDAFPLAGDEVLAYDVLGPGLELSRFKVSTGQLLEEWTLDARVSLPNGLKFLGSGVGVGITWSMPERPPAEGPFFVNAALARYDIRAGLLDTVTVMPGSGFARDAHGPQSVQFSPEALSTAAGDRIYGGWSGRYEIRVYDSTRSPVQVIRAEAVAEPVTDQMRKAVGEVWLETRSPKVFSEVLPFFIRLLATPDNWLWVRRHPPPEAREHRWDIFDPEGQLRSVLRVPAGYRLTEVGSDYVLGVWRNEDDVESVRGYRVGRPDR
jgi:hypothetical protein